MVPERMLSILVRCRAREAARACLRPRHARDEVVSSRACPHARSIRQLDHLLAMPDPGRRVAEARRCFDDLSEIRCTWSETRLSGRRFDVDHALPFSLWRNNDLWNLFPAAPKVNAEKRDRLPSHDLLMARRDRIVPTWQGLHERLDIRFAREAQTLLGRDQFRPDNWEALLFTRFVEACEITATLRGAERWQPADFAAAATPRAPRPRPGPLPYPRGEEGLALAAVREGGTHPEVLTFPEVADRAFTHFLPLVGSLAAGAPFHGFDAQGLSDLESLDWIEVPRHLAGGNRFVVRVAGDSMAPTLHVGDLAVFEYHRRPRRNGQVVIANLPEFGMTESGVEAIKRIRQDERSWTFESDSPAHETLTLPKADSDHPILGIFVGKL